MHGISSWVAVYNEAAVFVCFLNIHSKATRVKITYQETFYSTPFVGRYFGSKTKIYFCFQFLIFYKLHCIFCISDLETYCK